MRRPNTMNKLRSQSSFTLIAPIISGHTGDVTRVLDQIGNRPACNGFINFGEMESVHFASMLILPSSTANDRLLLETNYDGPLDLHLDDFIQHAPGLNEVFGFCFCFPSGAAYTWAAIKDYLVSYSIRSSAFHVAFPGRTVADIKNAIHVSRAAHDWIAQRVNAGGSGRDYSGLSEEQLRSIMAYEFRSSPTGQQPLNSPTTGDKLRTKAVFNVVLIVIFALVLLSSLFLIFRFFAIVAAAFCSIGAIWLVARGGQDVSRLPEIEPLPAVEEIDAGVNPKQNHMCALTPLRPGLCRLLGIKAVLLAVKVACKWVLSASSIIAYVYVCISVRGFLCQKRQACQRPTSPSIRMCKVHALPVCAPTVTCLFDWMLKQMRVNLLFITMGTAVPVLR